MDARGYLFIPWTSSWDLVEFHPPAFAKGNAKKGKTSQADLKEIHWRSPDLTRAMQPEELTSFEQIVFGD